MPDALTSAFHRALLASSIFVLATAILALRTSNTRGEAPQALGEALPEPADGSPVRSTEAGLQEAA